MHNTAHADQDIPPLEEEFDEIVLCVLADTAKRVLGSQASGAESFVLGKTKWSDDVTVTHSVSGRDQAHLVKQGLIGQDAEYIKKWYTIEFDADQAVSQLGDRDDSERVQKGQKEFQP